MGMPSRVNSAFEIAVFFIDKASSENEYIQPQKLHGLLFLSQAYFSVAFQGRKLMPAVFVADERGPLEPNLYVAFSSGRTDIDLNTSLPEDVLNFLNLIWKRFGKMKTERLISKSKENSAYKKARKRGQRAEILFSEMRIAYNSSSNITTPVGSVPKNAYQPQSGKTVRIKKWMPGQKS
tara:strand:- start:177 stop:713 length:537 start_codon:yes stop_codon:yes gene_type:complete